MRRGVLALLAGALVAAGCGASPGEEEPPPPEQRLEVAPPVVHEQCAAIGAIYDGVVMCPRRILPSRDPAILEFGGAGRTSRCGWLLGVRLDGTAMRVAFGGQCRPLPLAAGGRVWPRDPSRVARAIGLVGEGGATATVARRNVLVRGRRGIVVAFGPRPAAYAGHQALLWNEEGQGLAVSAHFDEDVPADLRVRLLRGVAASMRPVASGS